MILLASGHSRHLEGPGLAESNPNQAFKMNRSLAEFAFGVHLGTLAMELCRGRGFALIALLGFPKGCCV